MKNLFTHANRGKGLEEMVTIANERYALEGIALISRIPNDWTVLRKYNPFTKKSEIYNAFPKKTTIDYIGIYNGKGIAFECKETDNKTSYPLSQIHDHQFNFLGAYRDMGGFAFYIVRFKQHNRTFLLFQKQLEEFIKVNSRKSIPFHYFEQYTREISFRQLVLDYLGALEG